jgi:Lrp/AsnC family transcriptional regulator, regulator for asnA, asnC and gidA
MTSTFIRCGESHVSGWSCKEDAANCRDRDRFRLTQCEGNGTNRLALRRIEAQLASVAERRGPVRGARRIDETDQGIIEALQANGRESFRAIAAQLGVSEATVRARYARLCDEQILQVVAVTNPLGLGFEQALIGIKTAGSPEPVADEISRWTEADYVVVTAGQYDLVVEVVAADRRGLLEVTNRMRELDGVVTTETFLYLDLVKQLYDWGTRP